jgi:Zn finger protein HypA/HybF involved in hydrogenase expression
MGSDSQDKGADESISNDNDAESESGGIKKPDSKIAWETAEESQRLDVYETALTRAMRDYIITDDEKSIVDGIREQLNITNEEHEEVEERVLSRIKEHINCPKCEEDIEIDFSKDEKIRLKCPGCGAKGRITNPFLEKMEAAKKARQKAAEEALSIPEAKRIKEDAAEEMMFICPHCTSSFQTTPTEDPQKIPCPSCSKDVKIIKPIKFECPRCEKQFPSVVQSESKIIDCPFCHDKIELKK